MNKNIKYDNVREAILEKIKTGKEKMRPHWFFAFKTFGLVVLFIISFGIGLFVFSAIPFLITKSGSSMFAPFGFVGFRFMLLSLPWMIIILFVLLMFLAEKIANRFDFVYKRPVIISASVLLGVIIISGLVIAKAELHERAFNFAERNELPILPMFYHRYDPQRMSEVYLGTYIEAEDAGFTIVNDEDKLLHVLVSDDTKMPFGMVFKEGDSVMVLGDIDDDTITAFGVRIAGDDFYRLNRKTFPATSSLPFDPRGPRAFLKVK